MSKLMWQIRNFTCFPWVSGGLYAEMNIHQIDELCWLKGDLPATARGIGGRARAQRDRSQEFDSISIEWTFPDGTKATDGARWLGESDGGTVGPLTRGWRVVALSFYAHAICQRRQSMRVPVGETICREASGLHG